MNLSKGTISLRKQEMTECSNESTDYNLTVYRYVMHVFCVVFSLIRFLLAFFKCIGKQLLSDLHKSFAISIRILLSRRTFMIIFFSARPWRTTKIYSIPSIKPGVRMSYDIDMTRRIFQNSKVAPL